MTSCANSCTYTFIANRECQCYSTCSVNNDCCDDYDLHCEGYVMMAEEERYALYDAAAFSVFYSILLFVFMLVLFVWACYTLHGYVKKHGLSFTSTRFASNFVLADTRVMIVLSYMSMAFYTLALFCYLCANGSLGVHYDSLHDSYRDSQTAAIVFWFLGHTILYQLFMLKLHLFIGKTTYTMNRVVQYTAYLVLFGLYVVSVVVACVWIEEFHNHFHFGTHDTDLLMACMVVAFAAHVWFCCATFIFFAMVLYRVTRMSDISLIERSGVDTRNQESDDAAGNIASSSRKDPMQEQVVQYMTRITVLLCVSLVVTVFCMFMWMVLMAADSPSVGLIRFSWWLFPLDALMGFLAIFLGLNFDPALNDVYAKVCIAPHKLCQEYCVKATISGKRSRSGTSVVKYGYGDDDDDDEEDDHKGQLTLTGNHAAGNNGGGKINGDDDDDEEDEDEEDDSEEDDAINTNTKLKASGEYHE